MFTINQKEEKKGKKGKKIDILGYKKEKYAFMYFQIHVEFYEKVIYVFGYNSAAHILLL